MSGHGWRPGDRFPRLRTGIKPFRYSFRRLKLDGQLPPLHRPLKRAPAVTFDEDHIDGNSCIIDLAKSCHQDFKQLNTSARLAGIRRKANWPTPSFEARPPPIAAQIRGLSTPKRPQGDAFFIISGPASAEDRPVFVLQFAWPLRATLIVSTVWPDLVPAPRLGPTPAPASAAAARVSAFIYFRFFRFFQKSRIGRTPQCLQKPVFHLLARTGSPVFN